MVSTISRLVEVAPRSSIPVSAGASTVSVTRHILGRLNWRAAVGNKLPVNFGLHPLRRLTAAEASTGHLHRQARQPQGQQSQARQSQARQSHGQSLRMRPRLWSIMAVLGLMAAWGSGVPTASAQPQIVESASDYEDCVAHVRASGLPKEAVAATISACDGRFPGRRKPGGGYTYFDFMQNRHFDIAGPIPTKKELRRIDHAFIRYLADRNGARTPAAPPRQGTSQVGRPPKPPGAAHRTARPRTAVKSAKAVPRPPRRKHVAE